MSEGDFVEVTPHNATKEKSNDIDESSDTYDTIEWLLKNVRATTAVSACTAFPIPGSIPLPA